MRTFCLSCLNGSYSNKGWKKKRGGGGFESSKGHRDSKCNSVKPWCDKQRKQMAEYRPRPTA